MKKIEQLKKCTRCDGRGEIEIQREYKSLSGKVLLNPDYYDTETVFCSRCKGSGYDPEN